MKERIGGAAVDDPFPITDDVVEAGARAVLALRGFGFYSDPMEGGQDAYDISNEALIEARVCLGAAKIQAMSLARTSNSTVTTLEADDVEAAAIREL